MAKKRPLEVKPGLPAPGPGAVKPTQRGATTQPGPVAPAGKPGSSKPRRTGPPRSARGKRPL